MIWAFEYLNEKQIQELKFLNPLMDFNFDFGKRTFYWKTFCAGFETIYKNDIIDIGSDKIDYEVLFIPINKIQCYPNEKDCVDNIPETFDSYDYISEKIKAGTYNFSTFTPIKVVSINGKYFTIDKSRLKAFRDASSYGLKEFEKIPARLVYSLEKEIRRIRLFAIEQVRQGFICDNWEEARLLSMYLQDIETIKTEIENKYKWIKDYLLTRKDNIWLKVIAIPVSIYLEYYEKNDAAIKLIDLESLMKRY